MPLGAQLRLLGRSLESGLLTILKRWINGLASAGEIGFLDCLPSDAAAIAPPMARLMGVAGTKRVAANNSVKLADDPRPDAGRPGVTRCAMALGVSCGAFEALDAKNLPSLAPEMPLRDRAVCVALR